MSFPFRRWQPPRRPQPSADDIGVGPIRGELLGAERLAERARLLASEQRTIAERRRRLGRSRPERLLVRLAQTRRILADANARLSAAALQGTDVGPAGEWLLDNYHLVREHASHVRESLPVDYFRELPFLTTGVLTEYPRVYEIAITIISHTEGRIDLENVDLFVGAFQESEELSLGELWAIPAMLRLGLLESVRRMTLRTVQRLDEIQDADRWTTRILAAATSGAEGMRTALSDVIAARRVLTPAFVSRLLQRLRATEGAVPSLVGLEQWFAEEGLGPTESATRAAERLALTTHVMANSIMSLRGIAPRDWRQFVEGQSTTDRVLREDPSGDYAQMTFATRDEYRHAVERVARRAGLPERAVAQEAIALAQSCAGDPRREHVGYWLVDDGIGELERRVAYRSPLRLRLYRALRRNPNLVYVGGIAVTALGAIATLFIAVGPAARIAWASVLLAGLLPAFDIVVSLIGQLVTALMPPRVLPRLDFSRTGVPDEYRTAVVIPTLFSSVADAEEAVADLEVQFLANRDPHIHYALLSDFTDADTEIVAGDDAIVAAAAQRIEALNARYAPERRDAFFLFHRARQWNPQQGAWMGWERKRGKLSQFNHFVRGGAQGAFATVVGEPAVLQQLRYVITLDSDTVLPPDEAAALIGTMAHPLNRAVFDPFHSRVVKGYGILQPRVGVSLASAHRSAFAVIHSGHPGVDPYTTAVSDVYQDLYGEGSYTGKGIYDVDAFETATHGRFPENTLLSHDLIEGNYARAGLVTDIIVYDDYPAGYLSYSRRKHRWIRGDWQLLRWLTRRVPGPTGSEPNRLSMLARWKILDNLRRSTVEIALLALFFASWVALPGSIWRWTVLGVLAVAAPWIVALLIAVASAPRDKSWRAYYGVVLRDGVTSLQQILLAVIFLPHQALLSIDAIGRTLWRLGISRRHLLEWQSAAVVEQTAVNSTAGVWRTMWPAVLLPAAVAGTVLWLELAGRAPHEHGLWGFILPVALLVLLWSIAPEVARRLSQPIDRALAPLTAESRRTALRYARAHWEYFAQSVSADTAWLAPDNVQEDPERVVAMRTSPTNIGLQLLATVSAHDLGFISSEAMTEQLERTFESLERMERFKGHFLNWYALPDLRLLDPAYVSTVDSGNLAGHLIALQQACSGIAMVLRPDEQHLALRLRRIAATADRYVREMEFAFLYEPATKLFRIGYNVQSHQHDASSYDLLASEARLASFIAIAKDEVPPEHWFHLGRTLTRSHGEVALVSWSGSMFEYLMPILVMRAFPATLLGQTYAGSLNRQIRFGEERDVPWGVSESAYNQRDRHLTYQYRAFGVPDLALQRGLGRELVIAPYASALAVMVDPERALANLSALESLGALGEMGFYDALDWTRPTMGRPFAMVRCQMAHHIGMSLVAFTNALLDGRWQERFHADPRVRAAALLLDERVPNRLEFLTPQATAKTEARPDVTPEGPVVRHYDTAATARPHVALLGHAPYTVMVTHAGGGYSRCDALAVTRWRADGTCDDTGQFCYVRDVESGHVWSSGHQPTGVLAERYHADLATDRVTLFRVDGDLETRTEIAVVPEDSAEVRRVTVTNNGRTVREVELTSYGEIVMAPRTADRVHPAFGNLFVETEWHEWCSAITATRRPRSAEEPTLWCAHLVDTGRHRVGPVTCETDRSIFLGRGRSTRRPAALDTSGPLSGSVGAVLDPIFALRTRVRLEPGHSECVSFTTLVAPTRERLFALTDRYHVQHAAQRALDLAWTSAQIELRELGVSPADAAACQELATYILYPDGAMRAVEPSLARNEGWQQTLWAHGISGDWPVVLATIDTPTGIPTLERLLVAHRYWRLRGVTVDLVVVSAEPQSYLEDLRTRVTELLLATGCSPVLDISGGVHLRNRNVLGGADFATITAVARLAIACDGRTLERVVADVNRASAQPPTSVPTPRRLPRAIAPATETLPSALPGSPDGSLRFENGIGGLTDAGNYRIRVHGDHLPPAPWANVIANAAGGFVVTERGGGASWAGSSYFFRLTPWFNDPVTDPVGEALYLRDEESGAFWSATPAPVRSDTIYEVEHAPGATRFRHDRLGIATELTLAMAGDDPVKLSVLQITNRDSRPRVLSITSYVEWTLGVLREQTQHRVQTRFDAARGAILADNPFDAEFSKWVAFSALSEPVVNHSASRREFIGRHGTLSNPDALQHEHLAGGTGLGADPCAALRCTITLAPGESRNIIAVLGAGQSEAEAHRLLDRYRNRDTALAAVEAGIAAWERRLSVVRVETPEPAFDAIVNRWSLYQALACRMWGRTAVYQSSGAFGFRDQLQDVMALVYAEPGIARAHILRAASRQFVEGDVQHWWHPESGRGVRTRFSDDLAWLPFVVDQYLSVTGDRTLLDDEARFLTMRTLAEGEHEVYDLPSVTEERGSIYEHCVRALRKASTVGAHGLPLIGTGDWNDGMNRVGMDGRGESVWLAWFLTTTLRQFAVYCDARGDAMVAAEFRATADGYVQAAETHGWDGAWYRRAFFDDGTPLGSASQRECQIDSIAQSWSVISGGGSPEHQAAAMASLEERLVDREARLLRLLTPPFDTTEHDPGYIKGYVPGVRENGAQYTHAALWAVMATARRGDGSRAFDWFQLINPFTHTDTVAGVARYRGEPYVVAADVYTTKDALGRAGWTWYTGSASWMYRVGLEELVGFRKIGDTLRILPAVPDEWPELRIEYRFGAAVYAILVMHPAKVGESATVTLDGVHLPDAVIPLVDDGTRHEVRISP